MVGPVRRIGNRLAVVIPSKDARRAHISEGVPVRARITVEASQPFGLLKNLADGAFDRQKDQQWRDRL